MQEIPGIELREAVLEVLADSRVRAMVVWYGKLSDKQQRLMLKVIKGMARK